MPVQICRVCFEEGTNLKGLGRGYNSTGYKLSSCVPEINVYIVENPTICRPCLCMVEVAYKLRETCLENEKRFNQNFDRNDFVLSKKTLQLMKKQLVESPAGKDQPADGKEVAVVFNDYFEESDMACSDSKDLMITKRDIEASNSFMESHGDLLNSTTGTEGEIAEIKTEEFDPSESLLEVAEEYITTESNDSFVSRVNSEGVHEYACIMCDKTFSSARGLKYHLNKMHYKIGAKTKLPCATCRRVFTTKGSLTTHSKNCAKNKIKVSELIRFNHVNCVSSTGNSNSVSSNDVHLPNDVERLEESSVSLASLLSSDTFTCEKCLKIFTTRASFRAHSKHCNEMFYKLNADAKMEGNDMNVNPGALSTATFVDVKRACAGVDAVDSHSDNGDSDFDPSYKSSSESADLDSDGSDYSVDNKRKRQSKGRNSRSSTEDKRKRVDLQIKCDTCSRSFVTKAAYTIHSKSCRKLLLSRTIKPDESATSQPIEAVQVLELAGHAEVVVPKSEANEYINIESDNDSAHVDDATYISSEGESGDKTKNPTRPGTERLADLTNECVCKICEEKLPNQQLLEAHVNTHIGLSGGRSTKERSTVEGQGEADEITFCCGKEYSTVSLLQLHTYKEHGKSCGVCNKHYTSYNELFAHLLEHTKE